jgi:hypothetical protein
VNRRFGCSCTGKGACSAIRSGRTVRAAARLGHGAMHADASATPRPRAALPLVAGTAWFAVPWEGESVGNVQLGYDHRQFDLPADEEPLSIKLMVGDAGTGASTLRLSELLPPHCSRPARPAAALTPPFPPPAQSQHLSAVPPPPCLNSKSHPSCRSRSTRSSRTRPETVGPSGRFWSKRSSASRHLFRPLPQTVPQVFPPLPQVYPPVPQVFPAAPQVFPPVPQIFPPAPQVFPAVPQVFPSVPQVFLPVPQVFPAVPQVFPPVPQVFPPQVRRLQPLLRVLPPQVLLYQTSCRQCPWMVPRPTRPLRDRVREQV